MKWPPIPENGRIPYVKGADATVILVIQTLRDHTAQPFNDDLLALKDQTFSPLSSAIARIRTALERLQRVIEVVQVSGTNNEEGDATFTIIFLDRETRTEKEVTING